MARTEPSVINPLVAALLIDKPRLSERPQDALTSAELAEQSGLTPDEAIRWLKTQKAAGRVQEYRVKTAQMKRAMTMYVLVPSDVGKRGIVGDTDDWGQSGGKCPTCKGNLQIVRPGKWQCPKCG